MLGLASIKKISVENAKVACEFLDRLRIENKSYGRIANYAECAKRILILKDDKRISEWTRKEIELIHRVIADADYENSVKKDTLVALKRLYHFAKHDEIADKAKGKDYDMLVTLFEGSYRLDELFNMRIGGLQFENDFVRFARTHNL